MGHVLAELLELLDDSFGRPKEVDGNKSHPWVGVDGFDRASRRDDDLHPKIVVSRRNLLKEWVE